MAQIRQMPLHNSSILVIDDEEIKRELASAQPYQRWLDEGLVELDELAAREHVVFSHESVLRRQQVFGYTHEELKVILAPMARAGAEPIGSMGSDTPIAVLSERPRMLFDYFQQLFAQVTNPPLDAIREELVTSLGSTVGPESNLLLAGPQSCRQLVIPFPVIDNDDLAKIIHQRRRDVPRTRCRADQRPVPRRRWRIGAATSTGCRSQPNQQGDRRGCANRCAVGSQ